MNSNYDFFESFSRDELRSLLSSVQSGDLQPQIDRVDLDIYAQLLDPSSRLRIYLEQRVQKHDIETTRSYLKEREIAGAQWTVDGKFKSKN